MTHRTSGSQRTANPATVQDDQKHFAPTLPTAESAKLIGSAIHRVAPASAEHAGSGTSLAPSWPSEASHKSEFESAGTSPP